MKPCVRATLVPALLFTLALLALSCSRSKDNGTRSKDQLVMGNWNINRIQLRIYSGNTFLRDTILPQTPMPSNFVSFEANGNFKYCFNKPVTESGIYQFVGTDSVVSNVTSNIYRWKILTLTDVLFTVMNTSTDPAYPGMIVETYQTFVR